MAANDEDVWANGMKPDGGSLTWSPWIIKRGAEELALMVETVASRLDFGRDPLLVTVTGGLSQAGPAYREPLDAAIRRHVPAGQLVEPALSPVIGAALLALDAIGIPAWPDLVADLRRQG